MPRGTRAFTAAFVLAFFLGAAGAARGYHTRFVQNTCNTNDPTPTPYITRDGSIEVALRGRYEGYQWGGGCWNDNDVDDSPGDPLQDPRTGGEGGDCSGFTFKVWRESTTTSDGEFYQWNKLRFVHGPYAANDFKNSIGAPNVPMSKAAAIRMDAFASSGHIGMVYATNANGSDQIIEAKGEAYGTNIWTRTYRGDSSYSGVHRVGWS
jgi:hypothetical protein